MRQLWDCRCLWAMVKLVWSTLLCRTVKTNSLMFVLLQVWFVMVDPYCFPAFCPCSIVFAGYPWLSQVIWFELYIAGISWDTSCQSLPWRLRSSTWPFIGTDFGNFYPDHEIFDILTNDQLQLTLPVKIHGDEGRRPLYFAKSYSVVCLFVCLGSWKYSL